MSKQASSATMEVGQKLSVILLSVFCLLVYLFLEFTTRGKRFFAFCSNINAYVKGYEDLSQTNNITKWQICKSEDSQSILQNIEKNKEEQLSERKKYTIKKKKKYIYIDTKNCTMHNVIGKRGEKKKNQQPTKKLKVKLSGHTSSK